MPVRFLFGPAGSGKTRHCVQALQELERRGRPGIYLVPEQSSYISERELLSAPGLAGLRHVRVFSFSRFAWWLRELADAPGADAVSTAVRPMILRAVLAKMPQEVLGPLAILRSRPGFLEELSRFVGEVRNHGTVEFLDRIHREFGGEDPAAPGAGGATAGTKERSDPRRKILALVQVFESYASTLRDLGRVDPEQAFSGLEVLIHSRRDLLSDARIFVDGFLSWTRREQEILVALAHTGAEVTIALCCDPEAGGPPSAPVRAPFLPVRRTLASLRRALDRAGVPVLDPRALPRLSQTLESALYNPDPTVVSPEFSVRLQPARDPRQEVWSWARQLDRWLRAEEPTPPSRCAVILRSVEPYRELIREIFPRYHIPFFLDERRQVLAHPRVRLLLDSMEVLLSHWRRDAVITFLRNPFLRAAPASIDLLESLSLEYGRDFEAWTAEAWEEYALPPRTRPRRPPEEEVDEGEAEREDPTPDTLFDDTDEEPEVNSGVGVSGDGRIRLVDGLRRRLLGPVQTLEAKWRRSGASATATLPGAEAVAALRALEGELRALAGQDAGRGTDAPAANVRETSAGPGASAAASGSGGNSIPGLSPDIEEDAQWDARVEQAVDELLREMEGLWSAVAIPLDEFARTLRQGLESCRLGVAPLRLEQVMVAEVQRSRLSHVERAIVGGLNDGVFPRAVADDSILNQRDRRMLEKLEAPLGPTAERRQEEEVYLFYVALTRASRELVLTWSLMDATGQSLSPSLFLDEVTRPFPGLAPAATPPEPEELPGAAIQTAGELGDRLVAHLAQLLPGRGAKAEAVPDPVFSELYNLVCAGPAPPSPEAPAGLILPDDISDPRIADLFQAVRAQLTIARPALLYQTESRLPEDLCRRVFPAGDFLSSVSRLQEFARCPYLSFARNQLRLVPRPRMEVTPLETGAVAHAALEQFFASFEGTRFDSADRRLAQIFRELEQRPEFLAFRMDDASRYRLRNTQNSLRQYIHLELRRLGSSPFRIAGREVAFDARGNNFVRIDLPGGDRLLLRGRIDRLDLKESPRGPLGLVIDYKRSARQGLPKNLVRGLDLQLAGYLLFVRQVQGWEPAGGFYVPVLPAPRSEETLREEKVNAIGLKMHGFFLGEERDEIDQATGMLVGVGPRSAQALPDREAMKDLLDTGERFLARYAATQKSGWIEPIPLEESPGHRPCADCDYATVCRFLAGQDPVRRQPGEGMVEFSPGGAPA